MSKYYFQIISKIEAHDYSDKIKVGDSLYDVPDDEREFYFSYDQALEAGQKVLNGLDGGRAFNLARDSAEIEVAK